MPRSFQALALLFVISLSGGCGSPASDAGVVGTTVAKQKAAESADKRDNPSESPASVSLHSSDSPTGLHWSADQALERTNDIDLDGGLSSSIDELPEIKLDLNSPDLGSDF